MRDIVRVEYENGVYVISMDGKEMCSCKDKEIAFETIKWCWNKWLGEVEEFIEEKCNCINCPTDCPAKELCADDHRICRRAMAVWLKQESE